MRHEDEKTEKLLAVVTAQVETSVQLIALARILARQAAREDFAARQDANAPETEENDDDENPA